MIVRPPVRASHTASIRLDASPDAIFPLLCPVRETEWVPGWDPELVLSTTGHAETGAVFITPGAHAPDDATAIWIVTEHDPEAHVVAFVKVTPNHTVARIRFALAPDDADSCVADVTYTFTGLSDVGDAFVRDYGAASHQAFADELATHLNRFLHDATPPR